MAKEFIYKIKCGRVIDKHTIRFEGPELNQFAADLKKGVIKLVPYRNFIYISTSSYGTSNDFECAYMKEDRSFSYWSKESYSNRISNNWNNCFRLDCSISDALALSVDNPCIIVKFVDDSDYSYEAIKISGEEAYIGFTITSEVPSIEKVDIYRNYKDMKVAFKAKLSSPYYTNLKAIVNGSSSDFMGIDSSDIIEIPDSYFTVGPYNKIKLYAQARYGADYEEESQHFEITDYNFEKTMPTITNFEINSADNFVDEDVSVLFDCDTCNRYDIYNNGNLILSGDCVVGYNNVTLPKDKLIVGDNSLYVVLFNDLHDSLYGDFTKSANSNKRTIKLKTTKPTVSNIIIVNDGNLINNNTEIRWDSTLQDMAYIYVNENEKPIAIVNGGVKSTVIDPGAFPAGSVKFKVKVVKKGLEGVEGTRQEAISQTSATFKKTESSIGKNTLQLSSTNIDDRITISWESENQTNFNLYQDDVLIGSGYDQRSKTLLAGTLKARENTKIKLEVIYDPNQGKEETKSTNFIELVTTLTRNEPVIYNIEPSGLPIRIDKQVKITFAVNEFCDQYELKNASFGKISGVSDRVAYVGANVFKEGENVIEMTTYYYPERHVNLYYGIPEVRTARKVVKFIGYKQPNTPILNDKRIYNDATPKFRWESSDQTQFDLEVVRTSDMQVMEHVNLVSVAKAYEMENILENNTEYKVTLKVKNKYGVWSEEAEKVFETKFNNIRVNHLTCATKDGVVILTTGGYQEKNFGINTIFRKTVLDDDWVEIADEMNTEDCITDSLCPCNIDIRYKVRTYDRYGGYAESEPITIRPEIKNYIIVDVEHPDKFVKLDFVSVGDGSYVQNKKEVVYSGKSKPIVYKDKILYKRTPYTFRSLTIEQLDEVMDLIKNGHTFCIKDNSGNVTYCEISINSVTRHNIKYSSLSIDATEVDYSETHMYHGVGYIKIMYMDGEYSMDGSEDMNGLDEDYVRPPIDED